MKKNTQKKNAEKENPGCIVCGHDNTRYFPAGKTAYWRCDHCMATFMDKSHLPDKDAEKKRYELHKNDPKDPGYRRFLNQLASRLADRLPPRQSGLDFGCGPGPALADMMEKAGHFMTLYDPFFSPNPGALERTYDFIACAEVVEHFHRPAEEFRKFDALLRPGGRLGLMTCFQTDDADFENWHYRRDITHVVFYRETTFHVIASQLGWHCETPAKDIVFMQKPAKTFALPPYSKSIQKET